MTQQLIASIILWLAPWLPPASVGQYATYIHEATQQYRVSAVTVLAVIERESQFHADARSRTRDFGLMQLHVDKHTYAWFRGYEQVLLQDPEMNVHLGVQMMVFWRRYHWRRCVPSAHHWLAHYGWGYRVPKGYRLRKFRRIRKRIRCRLVRQRRLL